MAVAHNIDQLFAKSEAQDARISGLEDSVKGIADKLDRLVNIVTRQSAQPQTSITSVLTVVAICAGLLGSGATSIIWISSSISAAPIARLEERMAADRERMARIERVFERAADRKLAELVK